MNMVSKTHTYYLNFGSTVEEPIGTNHHDILSETQFFVQCRRFDPDDDDDTVSTSCRRTNQRSLQHVPGCWGNLSES